jgi:hypothetical protein
MYFAEFGTSIGAQKSVCPSCNSGIGSFYDGDLPSSGQRANASEIDRVFEDVMAKHRIRNGNYLSKESIGELADRIARYALGIEHRETLTPDEIQNLLTGKPPR